MPVSICSLMVCNRSEPFFGAFRPAAFTAGALVVMARLTEAFLATAFLRTFLPARLMSEPIFLAPFSMTSAECSSDLVTFFLAFLAPRLTTFFSFATKALIFFVTFFLVDFFLAIGTSLKESVAKKQNKSVT